MQSVLVIIHVLLSVCLIVLVLIQRGKGSDIGAAFGSGASQTVFGSRGSASFLTRATAVLATLFFVTSLSLAYLSGQGVQRQSVTEIAPPGAEESTQVPQGASEQQGAPADVPAVSTGEGGSE
jgi:preprotein translocase subunit SecG